MRRIWWTISFILFAIAAVMNIAVLLGGGGIFTMMVLSVDVAGMLWLTSMKRRGKVF